LAYEASWPDGCIDLTVTSPPYDNLRDYEGYDFDFEAIAAQLWRITKPGGVVVWVVGDQTVNGSESGTSFRQALHFMELGFNLHDTMIWNKGGFTGVGSLSVRYAPVFEYMFIFSNGKPNTFNQITDRVNIHSKGNFSKKKRTKKGNIKDGGKFQKRREYGVRFNIWKMTPHIQNGDNVHPAPFPEALARDHIISWSNPGDIVLDPMCGSGTTLKMAKQTGRQFIGIDVSEKYCDIARKRVEGAQPPLFIETAQEDKQIDAQVSFEL
jgi:DNA modification methylase